MFELVFAVVRYFAGGIKEWRRVGYQFRPSLYTVAETKGGCVSVARQEFSEIGPWEHEQFHVS